MENECWFHVNAQDVCCQDCSICPYNPKSTNFDPSATLSLLMDVIESAWQDEPEDRHLEEEYENRTFADDGFEPFNIGDE